MSAENAQRVIDTMKSIQSFLPQDVPALLQLLQSLDLPHWKISQNSTLSYKGNGAHLSLKLEPGKVTINTVQGYSPNRPYSQVKKLEVYSRVLANEESPVKNNQGLVLSEAELLQVHAILDTLFQDLKVVSGQNE
jgi:hypothetical protein